MSGTITALPVEQPLDEPAIAAAAAIYSARLAALTSRRDAALASTQRSFNAAGLPRGLYLIERVA